MAHIKENSVEILHYDNPDFPVMFRKNYICPREVFHKMELHCHLDLEFIYVTEGKIIYQVEDKFVRINAGEGIFVNSNCFHVLVPEDCDTMLYCLIFNPSILCSSDFIAQQYVSPIIENSKISYMLLTQKVQWQKKLLDLISDMENWAIDEENPLMVVSYINQIWNRLQEGVSAKNPPKKKTNGDLEKLNRMVSFIHTNYTNNISVNDLCEAGGVGRTKCSALFSKYTDMSPNEYICSYRLERGMVLLSSSDMSITEIAYAVGFSGASYFAEKFLVLMKMTPSQFRKCLKIQHLNEAFL